ncbi:MAG: hypothetical protein PF693_04280 [Spirochaetia bacterium]|nr:hypothetical protein [Spirochaetia bacterium]
MTVVEYQDAYKKSHSLNGKIAIKTMKDLKAVFVESGKLAADQVAKTTSAGLSDITSGAWSSIEKQLQSGADLISEALEKATPLTISDAYKNLLNVDNKYIMDAVKVAGVTEITKLGIENIGVGINFTLLQIQAERIYSDGYTFSDRVWNTFFTKGDKKGLPSGVNGDYQYRIKNLILTGQAQGRDSIDIAADIQEYILKGKDEVFKEGRYGKLIPGTGQYKRRITKLIDWRALRVVRSELNASLQQAGIMEGVVNPGSTKLFDWVKTSGNPIDISGSHNASGLRCIDLQRNSPYKQEDVPSYQHPSCSCSIRPQLKPVKDFQNELKDWVPGNNSELDNWYNDIYLEAQ